MTDSISREITFPQPREEVWRALTDSAVLAEWMYPNDFEPRVGHRFTFRVPPNPQANFDGIVHCEVLACAPPSELVYSWVAASGEVDTRVSYRLQPDGSGTRVFFEQSGFEQAQALKGAEYGWTMMLGKLAKELEAAAAQGERGRVNRCGASRGVSITRRAQHPDDLAPGLPAKDPGSTLEDAPHHGTDHRSWRLSASTRDGERSELPSRPCSDPVRDASVGRALVRPMRSAPRSGLIVRRQGPARRELRP